MDTRSRESLVTFRKAFTLPAWDEPLPAGTYRVVVDEAEVGDLSFLAYRRVATRMHLPAVGTVSAERCVIDVEPDDLDRAVKADAA
jgi:hypothetical protein